MSLPGLTIIGESINDSVPSTRKLYEASDLAGLKALAQMQDEGGAAYIDVNVGKRPPEFLAEAALKAYDLKRAGGKIPVLNSISPLRTQMFELKKIVPFKPILLVTERNENGVGQPNHTAEETYATAQQMLAAARRHGIAVSDCIIDPGISPIGADSENQIHRLMNSMRRIHDDPQFRGVHLSVGLSNFTVMIPSKRADGSPTKGPLESAFLSLAMPLGLDHVIGSVKRKYELLPPDHPAMLCLQDCLKREGFDVIMRVQEYYS
jgi:5-methyltetrahydrofolate--homocysteine methyltransferase